MIQVEQLQAFNGFGTGVPSNVYGIATGEYFYSQGLQRTQFGVAPKFSISEEVNDSTLSNLQLVNWFAQGPFTNPYVYGFASDGRLYRAQVPAGSWSQQRAVNSVSSHGNGLIFDQKNRLLYANDEFLGMTSDGSTFTDNWKDLTLSTTDFRPMDTYEDWVVIGNINQVALLNVTDDSFNANALNLPSGFNIRCIKSGINGILIGANFNNRGALILWDAFSTRSIAPWIWRNKNIRSIITTDSGWIVITQDEIFFTNGYSVQPIITDFPDYIINDQSILDVLLPQGADVRGNHLLFWGTSPRPNRQKGGFYRLDLKRNLFDFIPVANNVTTSALATGAIFLDSSNITHLSYTTTGTTNTKFIGRLNNSPAAHPYFISEQLGQSDNEKVAEAVKLSLGLSSYQTNTPDITLNIAVKIANARRNLFGWGRTNNTSAQANILNVDGTLASSSGINRAQAGDEVTILEGANAGQIRHITSIANQGTSTETWTLDSNLPSNTVSNITFNVSPFKLATVFSLSNISELKELFFDVQDKIKGKKFLIKILFENLPTGLIPELKGGQFIYDELGLKR